MNIEDEDILALGFCQRISSDITSVDERANRDGSKLSVLEGQESLTDNYDSMMPLEGA